MTIGELERLLELKFEIDKLSDQILRARAKAENKTAYISAAQGGRTVSDKVGNGVAELDELIARYAEACSERRRLMRKINSIESDARKAAIYHYVAGLSWRATAKKLGMTYTQIKYLRKKHFHNRLLK